LIHDLLGLGELASLDVIVLFIVRVGQMLVRRSCTKRDLVVVTWRPMPFEEFQERALSTWVVSGGVTEIFSESAKLKEMGIASVPGGVSR
jgi:hypothetical protein